MKRLMILGAIVMVVITACSSSGSKSSSVTTPSAGVTTTAVGATTTSAGVTTTSAGAATTAGATVVAKNIAFNPSTSRVHVGDVVTWEFQDGAVVHNVDGKGSLPDFFSGNPQSSGTYQYTFRAAGTYHYHCDVHPTMTATVIVS